MKKRYWLLLGLPMTLAACAADDTAETDTAAADSATMPAPASPQAMPAMPSTLTLNSFGGSSVTGQGSLTPSGEQTEVMVTLNGLEAGSSHPGHIHQGTCAAGPGPVVVPLSEITADSAGTGSMTISVPIALHSLTAAPHLISYHGEGGAPIACGEITAHVM